MVSNRLVRSIVISAVTFATALSQGQQAAAPPAAEEIKPEVALRTDGSPLEQRSANWFDSRRLSYQASVVVITESTLGDIMTGDVDFASGGAEGEIYMAQVSYKLAEDFEFYGRKLPMDVELPFVLGVVNEQGRDPFMQYNIGLTLRWKKFPWNKWVYTNFETGGGFTYSQYVLATERVMHPTRERSHLEFYWPIQFMLAHPRLKQHQLVLMLHHHSGGTIFHRGGANHLGFGYRYVPAEK